VDRITSIFAPSRKFARCYSCRRRWRQGRQKYSAAGDGGSYNAIISCSARTFFSIEKISSARLRPLPPNDARAQRPNQPTKRISGCSRITLGDQQSGFSVANHFRSPSDIGRNNRQPSRHRFITTGRQVIHRTIGIDPARQCENSRLAQARRDSGFAFVVQPNSRARAILPLDARLQFLKERSFADNFAAESVSPLSQQSTGVDEYIKPFY